MLTSAAGLRYADYDYLVTGELSKVRENGATSGVGVLATYAYNSSTDAGQLGIATGITYGNGASTSFAWDAVQRLSSLGHDLAGTTYDQTLGFSYNPASQITQNTRSNDLYAWNGHYNVTRNYTANGLNQYSASGSVTPQYDAKGNLTQAGGATYSYSSENLLTAATGGITLKYDPSMRLYETAGGSAGTTRLQYDGVDLVAEYDGSGTLLRRYVHGAGTDDPIAWYEGSGLTTRRFLQTDERGSVTAVTDGSGAVVATNAYDEYGIPASTNVGRFQYTGQTWLPELGMYYYKARIYSPTLGQFLQPDPIGYGDGLNIYAYALSDPTNRTDPDGTTSDPGDIVITGSHNCGDDADWDQDKKECVDNGKHHLAHTLFSADPATSMADTGSAFQMPQGPKPKPRARPLPPGCVEMAHSNGAYMRCGDGKLHLTPWYQEAICRDYQRLMRSNQQIQTGSYFLTVFGVKVRMPGPVIVVQLIVDGVTTALSWGGPPPGCR